MSNDELPPDARLVLFARAAMTLLARHGWRLLNQTELAVQAATLIGDMPTPTLLAAERACQQVYAACLYTAVQEPARQEVAYGELHAYLYRIALRQRPAWAEDAAQEAILLVYQKRQACRNPGAFLKFAIYQLLTAFHRLTPSSHEFSLEGALADHDLDEDGLAFMIDPLELEAEADTRAEAANLLRCLHRIIAANPRAKNQILAVILKYLEEWEDAAIAEALATTAANVQVLRSRGLIKLRAEYPKHCAQLQDS
ncbi:MAG: hypothetical protein U0350_41820 [Caldilineaceae bacterium]